MALLVMLATAASAFLVAQMLSKRAEELLRAHELVDLGDEASLRGWELIDQVEGLRDDLLSVSNNSEFRDQFEAGMSQEELLKMARSLCRRYWKNHVRVEIITLKDGKELITPLTTKAEILKGESWFPPSEAKAGAQLHMSPIERLYLKRTDLIPDEEPIERWQTVVWAVAPLGKMDGNPSFIRILMVLSEVRSPRHFFTLENADGVRLSYHDEFEDMSRGNNEKFFNLSKNEELLEALNRSRSRNSDPADIQEEPKVERLHRQEQVDLATPYFFQEGVPGETLLAAINEDNPDDLSDFMLQQQVKFAPLGQFGGVAAKTDQIRLLTQTKEKMLQLQVAIDEALTERYKEANDGLNWREIVECDQINSWAVRLLIGSPSDPDEYLIHYAVLDDELASSIASEMTSVRTVAILVALGFGLIGFFIAIHFIRPLKRMTKTALRITESERDGFHQKVAELARDLDIKRKDEVGDIARASKRLFEELIAFQEELEHRVNDRTRELRRTNSELEKAYEKLMSLSHEKDAFVAKVSHDLRQPLNAIFLQVEALRLSDLDEEQSSDVDRIHAHAARELNLVNDILEYQKIIMGAETLSKDEIDLKVLLRELEESFAPGAKKKGLLFSQRTHTDVETMVADDRRVRQVLGNLVGNACKFTKEGSVALEAQAREINDLPWIEFTISDTGRGMSPEEQAKAFVPFVSNKKDNAGGSGLGLSICKELVTQMGGKIGFVSELGKGTHFSVFLPCSPSSEHYEPKEAPAFSQPTQGDEGSNAKPIPRDATVLVVDDDHKVREMLSRMLKAEGYQVMTAVDGNEGLKLAKEHLPDAITLDVVMPGGKDGWEVLNELKGSPDTQSIPVIMVSVMAEQEYGGALDVEDYLVKPIDFNRLSRVIQRVTDQSASQSLLLVDDDTDSLAAMSRILEEAGWTTLQAHDGAEALETLSKTRPAAIILDLLMPVMDGFEFLEKMQENEHLRSIPVIVLSGKDPSEAEQEFLRERVTLVLKKGQKSADELVRTINAKISARESS